LSKIYRLLEQAGIDVYYDLDSIASHNKLIVIDNKTVLLGSANWTEKGLTQNTEASIMLKDHHTAHTYTAYINDFIKHLPEKINTKFPIPLSYLGRDGLLQQLHRKGADKELKLYLLLMHESFMNSTSFLKKDYKFWYKEIYEDTVLPWSPLKSASISNIVRRLEKRKAITRLETKNEIKLLNISDSKKQNDYIYIPEEFFTYGWLRKLSGPGVYFYLVNLAEFKKSVYKPVWAKSRKKYSWEYGIGLKSVTKAMKELIRYNLIEVKHDIPDEGQSYEDRMTNRYFINPLWKQEDLDNTWKRIQEAHTPDLFNKAHTLATRIYEPNDPSVVTSFIILIKIYGEEAVTSAVNTATSLDFKNGKWEMRYIVGILQKDYTPVEKP